MLGHLLHNPSKEEKECQAPKPILLDTGYWNEWNANNFDMNGCYFIIASGHINILYPWAPKILPLQMFRIGQLVISAVPAEFTTMSGRYLKNAVKKVRERERANCYLFHYRFC